MDASIANQDEQKCMMGIDIQPQWRWPPLPIRFTHTPSS